MINATAQQVADMIDRLEYQRVQIQYYFRAGKMKKLQDADASYDAIITELRDAGIPVKGMRY